MIMTPSLRRYVARGFTLIELLIVVIIVAILAAIAIPQFSVSTEDAKGAALDANLTTVRSAIEMYRVQHKNVVPGKNTSAPGTGSTCPTGGTAGSAGVNTEAAFKDQLTSYSNAEGGTCSVPSTDFPYGPYLRAIPFEPGSNKDKVTVQTTNAAVGATTADGWLFSTLTGKFQANNAVNTIGTGTGAIKYSDR